MNPKYTSFIIIFCEAWKVIGHYVRKHQICVFFSARVTRVPIIEFDATQFNSIAVWQSYQKNK